MWSCLGYVWREPRKQQNHSLVWKVSCFLLGETWGWLRWLIPGKWAEGEVWLFCLPAYRLSGEGCQPEHGMHLPSITLKSFFGLERQHMGTVVCHHFLPLNCLLVSIFFFWEWRHLLTSTQYARVVVTPYERTIYFISNLRILAWKQ